MKRILAMALFAALAWTSAQAADISGAGATFPYPIYAKWADAYKKITGVGLNYQSIGSGGGIKQIKAKTVTFGASDKPLKLDELDASGLLQFPMIMGGIVPVVNLPGIQPGQLTLDGQTLADIFQGTVTSWDDPKIKALNPGVDLPSKAPARHSFSPLTCRRRARIGPAKSAPTARWSGQWALAPRAMRAWPIWANRPTAP